MSYDVKFPNMEDYDMSKPGDVALYHAHYDFMPLFNVIENIKMTIDVTGKFYFDKSNEARESNDFITEEWAMSSHTLFNARVVPLSYYSLVLIMVSLLEEAFNTLCRAYTLKYNYNIEYKDIAGQGLERAITYLEKVIKIEGIKSDGKWEYIKTIRDARNMIVHNGGYIPKERKKSFEKFDLYIDEQGKLGFEYDDILTMYNEIIDYIERIFKKEPINK